MTLATLYCCMTSIAMAHPQNNELQQVSGKIKQVQTTISKDHQREVSLQQQLKLSENSLQNLQKDIARINQDQLNEQTELTHLKKQQQELQVTLTTQHQALAKQIRAAYLLGKFNEFKIFLNQEDPNTLNRRLGYYRYLTQNQAALITKLKDNLASLDQTASSIHEHQEKLKALLQQKQGEQKKQKDTQDLRQTLIGKLHDEMQSKQQQLSTLIANQQALQQAIDTIKNTQPSINSIDHRPFQQLRGQLSWPVKGTLLADFGSALDVGNQHLSGVIIKAPQGTPVHAISAGKVVFADWLRGFGLLVIINHGNGFMSLYARNQSLYVKVGDSVTSNSVIATTGNTGGYQLSSLYFEIRENGIPINPKLWCRYT